MKTAWLILFFVLNPLCSLFAGVEGFESGTISDLPWVTGGDKIWGVEGGIAFSGHYCAKAGPITHFQNTYLRLAATVFSGTVSFNYLVRSELNHDFLSFYIDGVRQDRWSGDSGWSAASFAVSEGAHEFKWEYAKDDKGSANAEMVLVDNFSFPENSSTTVYYPIDVYYVDAARSGNRISGAGIIEKYDYSVPALSLSRADILQFTADPAPPPASKGVEWVGGAIDIDLRSGTKALNKAMSFAFAVNQAELAGRLAGRSPAFVKAAYHNGQKWVVLPDSRLSGDKVNFTVSHLTKFAAVIAEPSADLSNILVYPNPFNLSDSAHLQTGLTFSGLSEDSDIKIYDLSGSLVRDIPAGSVENPGKTGVATWNVANADGQSAAVGLYIFTVTDRAGRTTTGKFAVRR